MEVAGIRLGIGPRFMVGATAGRLMVGGAGGSPTPCIMAGGLVWVETCAGLLLV